MNYIFYIIIGFSIIFIATSLGSAIIFFVKNSVSEKMNTIFLGFAGGIMVAASIWSLILPAIDQSSNLGKLSFLPVVGGFLLGSLFLVILDKVIPQRRNNFQFSTFNSQLLRIFANELTWIDLYCLQPREKMLKTYPFRCRPAEKSFQVQFSCRLVIFSI